MKTLHSPDGRPLATIGGFAVGERSILLHPVSKPGRILSYYFLEGGRHARLFLDGVRIDGTLRTRWVGGGREWEFVPVSPVHRAMSHGRAAAAASGGRDSRHESQALRLPARLPGRPPNSVEVLVNTR